LTFTKIGGALVAPAVTIPPQAEMIRRTGTFDLQGSGVRSGAGLAGDNLVDGTGEDSEKHVTHRYPQKSLHFSHPFVPCKTEL
jgi:hypothetical protein